MFQFVVIVLMVILLWAKDITLIHGQASTSSDGVKRSGVIVKPAQDRRLYRGLLLENGMKVLLISDPSTSYAAASMAVGVGALYDFSNIPGLANLVAHLLIEGSVKYPDRNDFVAFLKKFGGNTEYPRTNGGDQNFSFDIDPSQLKEALHRFAEFFLDPLLAHSSSDLDVEELAELIDCDYRDQRKDDSHRIAEVEKSMSKELHRHKHLFNGNYDTLYMHANHLQKTKEKSKSLLERAQFFHHLFYSSSIMTLAVMGKENLEELEKMVVPLFSGVKRQNVVPIVYKSMEHHPWGAKQLKHKIYVVPLDGSVHTPDVLVKYILNHKAPRSLITTLKLKGYTSETNVEYWCCTSGIAFFNISCIVTEKGLQHVDDIIRFIFQYIHLMSNDKKALERMYHEKRMIQKITFHERSFSNEEARSYVKLLARDMQTYPLEDILSHGYLLQDHYEPSVVEEFLAYLTPDNMNVTIVSPSLASIQGLQKEKHYETEYLMEKIPEEVLELWRKAEPDESTFSLILPPKNDLIPEHIYLYEVDENDSVDPRIIYKSSLSEIWFKQYDQLNTYRVHVDIEIFCSLPRLGVSELIMLHLFDMIIAGVTKVYLQSAFEAGTDIQTASDDQRSILFRMNGFADSLPSVMRKLFLTVTNLKNDSIVNEHSFKVFRKSYLEKLIETIRSHSGQLVWNMQHFKAMAGYSKETNLYAGKKLHLDHMKKFIEKVFRRIYVRVFVHGNCSRQKALEMANVLEESFPNSQGMLPQEILRPRSVDVEKGSNFVWQVFNETSANIYGCNTYYQLNTRPTPLDNVAGSVFLSIIRESCERVIMPDFLYKPDTTSKPPLTVQCIIRDSHGAQGLFIESTTKKNPRPMDYKIEQFLNSIPEILQGVSTSEFERLKKDAESAEYEKATGLAELSKRYWYEIRYGFHNFHRNQEEREQLAALKMADVITFFGEVLGNSASRRRKLAVHLFPNRSEGTTTSPPKTEISISRKVKILSERDSKDKLVVYKLATERDIFMTPMWNNEEN